MHSPEALAARLSRAPSKDEQRKSGARVQKFERTEGGREEGKIESPGEAGAERRWGRWRERRQSRGIPRYGVPGGLRAGAVGEKILYLASHPLSRPFLGRTFSGLLHPFPTWVFLGNNLQRKNFEGIFGDRFPNLEWMKLWFITKTWNCITNFR